MIKFNQVKITEEGEAKLLGVLHVRKEEIVGVWSCVDRFECIVKNTSIIGIRSFGTMAVEGNTDDIAERLSI